MGSKSKLKFYLGVISVLACGYAHTGELHVFSVKENPAGTVMVTTGIFTETTPSASAFRLRFDDNRAIQASEVKPAPSFPLETSVILCVDQSGSVGPSGIKQIQKTLTDVLAKSELQLNLALCAFDTEVRRLHGFSKDAAQLAKGVGKIGLKSGGDGKTKLYEAIALGLSELRSLDDKGPKRLIFITDGKDDGSSITDEVIASKANAQSITIEAIGFGNVTDEDSELLARLAKNTGGHFILAGSAQELSRALYRLLNLPPPRVFDVLFRYDVAEDAPQVNSAQLEFTPAGKASFGQAIAYDLSTPRVTGEVVAADGDSSDEWTINVLGVDVDLTTLMGALGGLAAMLGVAYKVKKRPAVISDEEDLVTPTPSPKSPKRARTSVGFAFPNPAKGRPAAILRCLSGPVRGRQYAIEQAIYRIGSSDANELQVSDDYLSHQHASIKYDGGNLYLSDSGSRNGTFLNDARLDQTIRAITPGDRIRVGKSTLEVVANENNTV